MRQFGLTTLSYPDERISALCRREKIELLNLAPPLLDFSRRNQSYVHGFGDSKGQGHWNETGHRVVGQLIARKLMELL
jgi:hypothetical protein